MLWPLVFLKASGNGMHPFAFSLHLSSCCLKCFSFCLLSVVLCLLPFTVFSQVAPVPSTIIEQQLEAITENNEDVETEDDSFLQLMRHFLKNPVNINTADVIALKELSVFSPVQIQNIIRYRMLLGNFISIYELQAVPGLDLQIIERIRPYLTVSAVQSIVTSIAQRLKDGSSNALTKVTQVLQKQKGFIVDAATTENYYPGTRQKLFMRYKYQYKNLLQYGLTGEKDAGEQFFKGTQKNGFDFYSAHFFVRNIGIIQSLAIGDFTVNLGQGLTQWQSLAFKKSADVTNIKRQLAVLRPYNSAGEINFHRGVGITLGKNNWEATVFASYKKVDANFTTDTVNNEDFISSLQTSGLHRTKSEVANKGAQQQLAFGGNIAYNTNRFHVGVNGVQYQFKLPIQKKPDSYNLYAISGNHFGNYSVDYSYAYRNLHFFGEAAFTNQWDKAFVNGLIASLDSKIDMSLLYRNISKSYQSLYTSAFTEGTLPNNEKGLYAGISVKPTAFWRIDAYADFYQSTWLKYLVDAPSVGSDYLVQATYKPNKRFEMYVRYRTESKAKNDNPSNLTLSPVMPKARQNFRWHFNYKINGAITFRNRVEMVWFDKKGTGAENGFLSYADVVIKPMMKKYAGSIRLQYFETEGYNSRMYAFENDVLYSFSIPVVYDKGYRYYLNLNYDVSKKLTLWVRWAQTVYTNKTSIGSGLNEIAGNKRSEIKLQVQYQLGGPL